MDQVLLEALPDVLDDRVTEAAVDKALERLRTGQEGHLDRRTQIERELSLIESRLGWLMEALVEPRRPRRCTHSRVAVAQCPEEPRAILPGAPRLGPLS